jgi:hypothetical protein
MTIDIDAKNANSILFTAGDVLIKVYYLKNTREYFMYYINDSGLVPIKNQNINYMSKIIHDNLPQDNDIDIRIRYSVYTSKKKKNQIQHLMNCKYDVNVSYSSILNCLRLIS